jgi:hypothetical protein
VKLTYKGILRDSYVSPRRRIYAHGHMIDFVNGVAEGLSEAVAMELFRRKIIKDYYPTYPTEPIDELEAAVSTFVKKPTVKEFYEDNSPEVVTPEFTNAELEAMGDVEPVSVVDDQVDTEEPTVSEGDHEESSHAEVEADAVEDEPEENFGNEEITKELLETLYAELNTWTAVANHLGITTTKLKKYRDEFGL